jgi:hydrogenase-4 component F
MLSGALLNCALFGIYRIANIVRDSGEEPHAMQMVMVLGAVSAVAGSVFLIRQHSFKRIWAYSSIENVGIMLTTIGLGSGALFFLQALNHSIAKVALFLLSGNIVQAAKTKRLRGLHGVLEGQPIWGVLLLLAAFAATGTPPFGMFTSELQILIRSTTVQYWGVGLAILVALTISFIAIFVHIGRIVCGGVSPNFSAHKPILSSIMPAALVICSLILGVFVPLQFWSYVKAGAPLSSTPISPLSSLPTSTMH